VKGAVPANCPAHMMLCCCDPFPGQEFAISPSSPLNWYLKIISSKHIRIYKYRMVIRKVNFIPWQVKGQTYTFRPP
jgi:hypothetical protein